jgi:predicted nucleotidyltransferase
MEKQNIIARLRQNVAALRAKGVTHAACSVHAHGDDRPDSDIDILVEIAPNARAGLFRYTGIVVTSKRCFQRAFTLGGR